MDDDRVGGSGRAGFSHRLARKPCPWRCAPGWLDASDRSRFDALGNPAYQPLPEIVPRRPIRRAMVPWRSSPGPAVALLPTIGFLVAERYPVAVVVIPPSSSPSPLRSPLDGRAWCPSYCHSHDRLLVTRALFAGVAVVAGSRDARCRGATLLRIGDLNARPNRRKDGVTAPRLRKPIRTRPARRVVGWLTAAIRDPDHGLVPVRRDDEARSPRRPCCLRSGKEVTARDARPPRPSAGSNHGLLIGTPGQALAVGADTTSHTRAAV
jgi:hypothetical protein